METHYTAYTKTINSTLFYFVKSFKVFPEWHNVSPVLEAFGMHTDFKKACRIARVSHQAVRKQLLNKIEDPSAKVIPLSGENQVYNLKRRHTYPSILKLMGLG